MSEEQYNLSSVMVVRRAKRKLPSVWGHLVRALVVLCLLILAVIAVAYLISDPEDAIAKGEVRLDPVPLPVIADRLDGGTATLPDLLDGIVPEGQNPTERLDALGNPVPPDGSDTELRGNPQDSAAPQEPTPTPPSSTGPKFITIDGQPITNTGRASSLVPAPIAGLNRLSPFGPIPHPGANGEKAVSAYARPFSPTTGRGTVSIIIGGLGIDPTLTRRAIDELPAAVTLSFAAHTNDLQSWINQARAAGHEVLLELPMESKTFDPQEPGADRALLTSVSAARNIRNLDYLLSRGEGYFAVTNYNGDKLIQYPDAIRPILSHLSNAGLGFIYDSSVSAPALPILSATNDLPFVEAFTLIDSTPELEAINNELLRLEAQATGGRAQIGVGFAYTRTVDRIIAWSQTLDSKNIDLAPASYVLTQPGRGG